MFSAAVFVHFLSSFFCMQLDLLAEDGELDEEELLGLDDCGAAFSNDPMQPVVNRYEVL